MSSKTLRSLVVSVSAETSAYQREMARASRMGNNYLRTIGNGNRQAASGWRAQQAAIEAQNRALQQVTQGAMGYARVMLGALAAGNIVSMADEWGQVASRLRMATTSEEEFLQVQEKLMEISDRTYKAYNEQAELFINSAKRMREMGYATETTTAFVDVLSSGLTVSATNAQQSASAIKAVTDSIALGTLRGDQWNTILREAPAIIEALGDALGKTQAELDRMARSGELTTSRWLPALISQQDELARKTEEMPTTVGDAYVRLTSHLGRYLGEQNEATTATETMASAINLLTDNIDLLASAALGAATAYGVYRSAGMVKSIMEQVAAVRTAQSAEMGRTAAQVAATTALARKTAAEVAAAQLQVRTTRGTDAHTAALSRLRLARLADVQATNAQATAERSHAAARSVALNATRSLLGLLGGPAGLAILAGTAATSWLMYSSNADKAAQASVDLKRPISELREEMEKLTTAQARVQFDSLNAAQTDALRKAQDTLTEIGRLSSRSDPYARTTTVPRAERISATQSFARSVRGGRDIDEATQELLSLIQPTQEVREEINRLALEYENARAEAGRAGELLPELEQRLNDVATAAGNAGAGLGGIGAPDPQTIEAWDKYLVDLGKRYASALDPSNLAAANRYIFEQDLDKLDESRAAGIRIVAKALDDQKVAQDAATEAERKAKEAATERARAAEKIVTAYNSTLASLNQQIELYGESTELARQRYEIGNSELNQLSTRQKMLLEQRALELDGLNARRSFDELMTSLQSKEEKLLTTTRERMKLLDDAQQRGRVNSFEYDEGSSRIAKATVTEAPKFGGLDASVGGPSGELIRAAEAREELAKWREEELERQQAYLDEKLISEEEHAANLVEIDRQTNEQRKQVQGAWQSATLATFSSVTGDAAAMLKELGAESSAMYKLMFLASKAASIAQAVVNTELAATRALAELGPVAGPPMAATVRGLGYTAVGIMAGTALAGMAHGGHENIPREGTWLLDGGERVLAPGQNADLTRFLNQQSQASGSGGATPQVHVEVNVAANGETQATAEATAGYERMARNMGTAMREVVREVIIQERRPWGLLDPNT